MAARAGTVATQTRQRIAGVVENMSWLELPSGERMEIFGSGGGTEVAEQLTRTTGAKVPLLGQIPLDEPVRSGADAGVPAVLSHPDSPASVTLRSVAQQLSRRSRGLAGRSLGLSPA